MGHRILICGHGDVKNGTRDFNMQTWRCEKWDTGF